MKEPTFFPTQDQFRAWLAANHKQSTELIVGFYKVKSGIPSMKWSESVDQALCFGWIDGVRHSINEQAYQIRFTPRKTNSIWSPVNIKKVKALTKLGLMQPAGLEAFKHKPAKNPYEALKQTALTLPPEFECLFRQNTSAWAYFEALAPTYKKHSIYWVISAVQDKTKMKRLNELIASSALGTNKWKDSKVKKKK